jgi:hypothetical protein
VVVIRVIKAPSGTSLWWSLQTGGRYLDVVVSSGLTVIASCFCVQVPLIIRGRVSEFADKKSANYEAACSIKFAESPLDVIISVLVFFESPTFISSSMRKIIYDVCRDLHVWGNKVKILNFLYVNSK